MRKVPLPPNQMEEAFAKLDASVVETPLGKSVLRSLEGRLRYRVEGPPKRPQHKLQKHACPDPQKMGKFACRDKAQCWEPCGELGHSEEHAAVVPHG